MRQDNLLKAKLADDKAVLGAWSILPCASTANVIAASGFDFLIIDMEHGPASFETAEQMVRAMESEGMTPLLRVPENNESWILRGLEIGTHGIVVPQITNRKEAEAAIQSIKYHPAGNRGFSPYSRSAGYTEKGAAEIAERENERTLSVLLVEGVEGINNLGEIMEVPGIDVIYLGIYDMSQSVGHPGKTDHPKVVEAVKQCTAMLNEKGITVGCLAQSQADIKRFLDIGIRFIAYKADCGILYDACKDISLNFKELQKA